MWFPDVVFIILPSTRETHFSLFIFFAPVQFKQRSGKKEHSIEIIMLFKVPMRYVHFIAYGASCYHKLILVLCVDIFRIENSVNFAFYFIYIKNNLSKGYFITILR